MNYSLARAGRTTHIKIVTVALVAAIAVVVVGINARISNMATAGAPANATVVKAGHPANYAGQELPTVR